MTIRRRLLASAVYLLAALPAGAGEGTLRLGIQPLSLPPAAVGEVLKRDRILRAELAALGLTLESRPFSKGGDMVPLLDPARSGDAGLDAALFGDMPALIAAARFGAHPLGLVKQTYSSLVARGYQRLEGLAGQRIAYAEGGAHYTLMQALATAGLDEKQVELKPMDVDEMPAALAAGRIDAFCAWEPAPSISLKESPGAAVIYRGVTTAYLVAGRRWSERHPEAERALGAALLRTVGWLKRSNENLELAARWAQAAREAYTAQPSPLSLRQVEEITRRDLLEAAGAPVIPAAQLADDGLLAREFAFLQAQGKLPADAAWPAVRETFHRDLLREIARNRGKHRVESYEYEE